VAGRKNGRKLGPGDPDYRPPSPAFLPKGDEYSDACRETALERKRELEEVRRVAALKREEGYQAALAEFGPQFHEQNVRIVAAIDKLTEKMAERGSLDKDDRDTLKALLKERKEFMDRMWGTSKQRRQDEQTVHHLTTDVNELIRQSAGSGGDILDVGAVEE
jgi:hypothetical protein